MKALEITWAKPMYIKYIFLCEGRMHLLITGLLSMDTFIVTLDLENCHLNLSLSAVCDCGISWSYSLTSDVSAVDSVKQKLSGKLCHESVFMPCLFLTVLLG